MHSRCFCFAITTVAVVLASPSGLAFAGPQETVRSSTSYQPSLDGVYTGVFDWAIESRPILLILVKYGDGYRVGGVVDQPDGVPFYVKGNFDPVANKLTGYLVDIHAINTRIPITGSMSTLKTISFEIASAKGLLSGTVGFQYQITPGTKLVDAINAIRKDHKLLEHPQTGDYKDPELPVEKRIFAVPTTPPVPKVASKKPSKGRRNSKPVHNHPVESDAWAMTKTEVLRQNFVDTSYGPESEITYNFAVDSAKYKAYWNEKEYGRMHKRAADDAKVEFTPLPGKIQVGQYYTIGVKVSLTSADDAERRPWGNYSGWYDFGRLPVTIDANLNQFGKAQRGKFTGATAGVNGNDKSIYPGAVTANFSLRTNLPGHEWDEFDVFEWANVPTGTARIVRFHYTRAATPIKVDDSVTRDGTAGSIVALSGTVFVMNSKGQWVRSSAEHGISSGERLRTGPNTTLAIKTGNQYWIVEANSTVTMDHGRIVTLSGSSYRMY